MADHGITMSAESIPLTLAKLKTQTRRVVRLPFPISSCAHMRYWLGERRLPEGWYGMVYGPYGGSYRGFGPIRCPWGNPGDRLYCKEKWAVHPMFNFHRPSEIGQGHRVWFAADEDKPIDARWRSSRHMPKWAARIWLDLTDVRAERLLDITPEDAIAEGVHPDVDSAVPDYLAWWDRLNAKRGYAAGHNPMVWALTFTLNKEATDGHIVRQPVP